MQARFSFLTRNTTPLKLGLTSLGFQILTGLILFFAGVPVVRQGPAMEIVNSAKCVLQCGRFDCGEYLALHRNLLDLSRKESGVHWQDVYSLTTRDTFFPEHAPIMSVLTIPFYYLFGRFGPWLFSQLLTFLVVWGMARFITFLTDGHLPQFTLYLALLGSPLLLYSYGYHYDLLGSALVVLSLALLPVKPFLAGLLLGLSVFIRPTYPLWIPFLLVGFKGHYKGRSLALFLAGIAIPSFGYFLSNHILWGSPFLTSFQRMPLYRDGAYVLNSSVTAFSLRELGRDLFLKLLGPRGGFLLYSPGLLLLPFAIRPLLRSRFKLLSLWLLLGALLQVLLAFSYHCARCTVLGNRFLLATSFVLLCLAAAGSAMRRVDGSA